MNMLKWLGLLMLSALVFFTTDRASATPITEGRIAFHSYTDYLSIDGVIYVFDLKTNTHYEPAELTIANGVQHAMNPKFSRDGNQLVFMGLPRTHSYDSSDDSWANYLDIFIYDFHTDKLTNLSEKAGISSNGDFEEDPDFSPDGQKVIFKRNRSDLWTIDLGTYGLSQITFDSAEKSGPRYSPDGNWVAYWVGSGSSADIYRMPVGSGSPQVVVDNLNIQDMYPAYLDDDHLLYSRWHSAIQNDDDIYVVDLSQNPYSHVAALFNSDSDDSDPFAIGGSLVGFSSNRSGKGGWDLFYGDLYSDELYYLEIASTTKNDLGGTFTPYLSGPIPEPSTILLLTTGLIGIAGYARIRSRRQK